VGIFPFRTHMTEKSMKMGYVEVETKSLCALFPWDQKVRGHVYHFSEILQVSSGPTRCCAELARRYTTSQKWLHPLPGYILAIQHLRSVACFSCLPNCATRAHLPRHIRQTHQRNPLLSRDAASSTSLSLEMWAKHGP